MEAPTVTSELDNEDNVSNSVPDKSGSAFSLEEIASSFSKMSQDANLTGEILPVMQTCQSADEAYSSTGVIKCESSSKPINDNGKDKLCYAHMNPPNASKLKKESPSKPSMGNSSNVAGKKMVWRVAGSNKISNETTHPKVEAISVVPNSNVCGENHISRIAGLNKFPNKSKVGENDFLVPVNPSQKLLISRDAHLHSSETSSLTSNASSDDDIEAFLFEMLGRGFQLERSTIREVLGKCGYDMKKSLETLLDISAVQLDRRNNLSEGTCLHFKTTSLSLENNVQKQNSAESNGSRINFVPPRQPKLGHLISQLHTPKRSDLTVCAPFPKTSARFTAAREVVTKRDNDENLKDEAASPYFDMKDDVGESSYYILRKAVKENRETMKQYYKAAAEAFAMGDRGRAVSLLEKGQVFYSKAREADEESVSKIFETSSGDGNVEDEVSLDLQDHDAKEAIRLVKVHLRMLSGIPLVRDLKINIGKDDQYVEKRKRLILKLLDKEGIKWIEDENSGAILVRLDEINPKNLSFGRKER